MPSKIWKFTLFFVALHENTENTKTMKTLDALRERIKAPGRLLRIAAVRPDDEATREALRQVSEERLAEVIGIDNERPEVAAQEAVNLVRQGKADMLMKGLIGTDQLLRAVLDKEQGLLLPEKQGTKAVLTHLAVAEIPAYHKLLFFTDAAVIPYPTHEQRIEQVRYAVDILHHLGIEEPRIALIHCSEKPGKNFPFVDGYQNIKVRAKEGDFGRCIADGPMDVKSACSLKALHAKGLASPLNGEADVLIMPDIEAGNTFYKSMTLFAGARTAGMLCGTTAPVVVPSRGDNSEAKLNSILFALASI